MYIKTSRSSGRLEAPTQQETALDHGHQRPIATAGGGSAATDNWIQQSWTQENGPRDSHDRSRQDEHRQSQTRHSPLEDNIEGHITSADLINPADALDLLAQVAQRSGEEERATDVQEPQQQSRHQGYGRGGLGGPDQAADQAESTDYPPIANGQVTVAEVRRLLRLYEQKYHHFFPVAHHAIFAENVNIAVLAREEPFLLSAVLTIASKNEPTAAKAFAACSAHTEVLISNVIYRGSASVGAVEALLILAEWPPQRLHSKRSIGRGEEDHGAWMQVGCAIRLGYLQGLEQTGLFPGRLSEPRNANRKRLAWADFPSLKPMSAGSDDLSLLFKAHLELTQLFSNAHDILYSSSMHREHLYSGGEYVRYIDDFASMLRNWKLLWGSLSFTPHVKATLVLSYDYLRLYIHAFAFQAELYRASRRARRENPTSDPRGASLKPGPLFTNVATSPDARFIYESIDAANSLLSTLNSFIDPVAGLRYMPLKYYLYIIYAAVFLFKARLAEAITSDGEDGVRRTIAVTVDRLQKSATNRQSPGYRYARLVHQLWLKPRSRESTVSRGAAGVASEPRNRGSRDGENESGRLPTNGFHDPAHSRREPLAGRVDRSHHSRQQQQQDPYSQSPGAGKQGHRRTSVANHGRDSSDKTRRPPASSSARVGGPLNLSSPNIVDFDAVMNDFSWRDLHAVGEFITNDTSTAESVLPSPDFDQRLAASHDATLGSRDNLHTGGGPQTGPMPEEGAVDDWITSWMGTDVIF
ncbi:hypothetical protein Micbo1qcDRAFT_199175 [Microdochium bolleyi]|uniref:Transcription factor domain-containing protein n=1 Tax=Microdochium bolleyi TaxID=196109 RepID=A0A136JGR7_9PEZI|nr:hypothetical protein Micbo1qcDRAFT_199175 [Microdochium bolleyi]